MKNLLNFCFLFIMPFLCNGHFKNDKKIDKITTFCSDFIYPYLQEEAEKEFEGKGFTMQQKKLLIFPKTKFYTNQSEQITIETKKRFSGKNVSNAVVHNFIIKKYKTTFPSLQEEVILKLSQELRKR